MMQDLQNLGNGCPTDEISAYIDGEISPDREMQLDVHFASCRPCTIELNQQKQFLCGLNASLNQERDIELPANFTKLIVANAESTVSGIRRPRELYNAVFICAGLGLFVLFALGPEFGSMISGIANFLEQSAIVGGIFGHLIYSVFVGIVIVVRSLAAQANPDLVLTILSAAFVIISLMAISRRVLRINRA
mgnify:CR=1 FL=1